MKYCTSVSSDIKIDPQNEMPITSDVIFCHDHVKSIYVFPSDENCEITEIRIDYMNRCDVVHKIDKSLGVVKINIKNYDCFKERDRSALQIRAKIKNNSNHAINLKLILMVKFEK